MKRVKSRGSKYGAFALTILGVIVISGCIEQQEEDPGVPQQEARTALCDESEIKRIQNTSIKTLVQEITRFAIENGERRNVNFVNPDGSDTSGYSYAFDFISGNEYYFVDASDYTQGIFIDSLDISYAKGITGITSKGNEKDASSRSTDLTPGRDPNIMESTWFLDRKADGSFERYQSFDCYGYSDCNYDKGVINEKIVDESPNAITDTELEKEFRKAAIQIAMYTNNCT